VSVIFVPSLYDRNVAPSSLTSINKFSRRCFVAFLLFNSFVFPFAFVERSGVPSENT
jgi:hypothetical protein